MTTPTSKQVADKKPRQTGLYLRIFGILLATQLLLVVLTNVAAYPTNSHREVGRQSALIQRELNDQKQIMTGNSELDRKLQALSTSSEGVYSGIVYVVAMVVTSLLGIVAIGVIYFRLRKYRVTSNPHGVTVMLVTTSTVIPLFLTPYLDAWLLGSVTLWPLSLILLSSVVALIISFIATIVVTHLFQSYYTNRRSFAIE